MSRAAMARTHGSSEANPSSKTGIVAALRSYSNAQRNALELSSAPAGGTHGPMPKCASTARLASPHRMRGAPRAASSTSRAHRASSDAVAATSRRGGPAVPVPALPVQHSTTNAAVRPRLPRFILSLPRIGCSPVMSAEFSALC
jgi:hypothetical protein